MADFQARVNALTNLGIDGSSTDPGQTELTQFLIDGVLDVTTRWISVRPADVPAFSRVSGEVTSNGSEKIDRAKILSVVREADTNDDWRECRYISPGLQSRVTDTDSLYFASTYNPVFTVLEDGSISVFPTPGSTTKAFKVYYINNNPRGNDDNDVTYASTGLAFFPKDKVYLVILYASIKSLESALSAKSIPAVGSDTAGVELTALTQLDSQNTIDDFDGNAIEFDQWFSTAAHLIEDEEDTELAAMQLQKIAAYIQAYQAQLQGNVSNYQWMQGRHQILLQQYNQAFGIISAASKTQSEAQQAAQARG